jgi:dTDP-4-dehydrorhamnose reductase
MAHVKALGHKCIGTQAHSREPGLVTLDLLRDRISDCVGRSFFKGNEQTQVVLCAVVSDMDKCLTDREASHRINVESIIRVIEEVRALNARPVFFSTCFVFDGTVGYYPEDYPLSPVNEYARHKVEVERYLSAHVPDAFIARLNRVVGDNPNEPQMLSDWYNLAVQGRPIVCIEGSLLSPTYVKDVAQAIALACQQQLTGVYHIANSEFFYRDELARQFCYALGKPPNVICKPLKEFNFADNRALKSYLDGSKFVKATGMRFTSMREVFASFKDHLCRQC